MAWKILEDWKEGKLGEVETNITFDRTGSLNLATAIFLAGFMIMLTWFVFKKKLGK